MKYLITGVAGLLGSRLADWIVENTNNEVIGIDDLSGGYIENVNKMEMYYGDTVLQELLEHSQQTTEDIEAFQEAYQGGANSGKQTEEKA